MDLSHHSHDYNRYIIEYLMMIITELIPMGTLKKSRESESSC